jgi:uncharacterized membrane protein
MLFVIATAIFLILTLILSYKDKSKLYPYLIYIIAILSLYQTTLLGAGVIGSDIQQELYYAKQVLVSGWDYSSQQFSTSNLSIVIGILAPFLAQLFNIDLIIVFKWVFPAFFAFVPVILYFAFKKQISAKCALYSSLFFIIIPVFNMEIASIAKSMISELFLAIAIWILLSDIKIIYKIGALLPLILLALVTHYTIGIFLIWYLIGITLFILLGRVFKVTWKESIPLMPLIGIILISLLFGFWYFSVAGNGQLITLLSNMVNWLADGSVNASVVAPVGNYIQNQPQFVRSGIGLDFFDSSILGQVFRIIQYFTQFMILVGVGYIIWNRKSFKPEFIAGILTALSMLSLCVLIPNFSAIANMTRFYHLSLFFLAPCFVMGFQIFKRAKLWIFSGIFITYYLFVSGIVFEVVKVSDIHKFEIPYSHALSADRVGTVGVYTQGDLYCAYWLEKSSDGNLLITGDWYTLNLLEGYLPLNRLYFDTVTLTYQDNELGSFYYLFLTDWNYMHNKYIAVYDEQTGGTGLRDLISIPDFKGVEVYSSGNSKVFKVEKCLQ